jgi:hypothetical protein
MKARLLPVLLACGLAVLTTGTGPAAADPGSTDKGKVDAPAYQPATGPACSLRASASKSGQDEWLSCLGVEATLDRAPSVGETATLRVTVRADAKLGPSDISVELPKELTWAQAPAGLSVARNTSLAPERGGELSVASTTRQLQVGESASFSGTVRAVSAGSAQIRARATAKASDAEVQAGQDDIFVTVGARGGVSQFGHITKAGPAPTAPAPATAGKATRPAGQKPQSVGTEGLAKPTGGDNKTGDDKGTSGGNGINAPCDTRVAGNWGYVDQNNLWHNSMNFQVQVWDADSLFGDDLLAVGITDFFGNYNICFDGASEGFPDSGTADVYVRFVAEVSQWKVQNGGVMLWQTGTTNDVAPGTTLNLGSLTTGDPALHRGLHAYDAANDAWLWIPKPVNGCFDQDDAACRQLVINWGPTSTDGTYYSPGSNDVHLAADDPNGPVTVVHEIGHALMDDIYNDAMPASPNCNPHSIQGTSSTGCAWVEGWAEWFPATVYNDPFFRWPNGASLDLENQSWANGWGEGDSTEGRVAGALIDITDFNNEGTWDRYGEGPLNIWFTFTHHNSNTFAQFWASRTGNGFNVADSGALADLYQNTIDYGFRDPLGNYAPLTRPRPVPPHNFGYNTSTIYWSVVALRPPAGSDYDLSLFDDRNQTTFLTSSAWGGSTVDLVVVDSNLRALGDYYPRVNLFSGAGNPYQIELAQGAQIVGIGASTVTMGSSNIAAVRDTFLTAGVPVTINVTPTNGGQNPELFLFGDDPAAPATFVQTRSSAVASSTFNGAGVAEQFTYTPTRTGWFGVAVINTAGSGNYTLTLS